MSTRAPVYLLRFGFFFRDDIDDADKQDNGQDRQQRLLDHLPPDMPGRGIFNEHEMAFRKLKWRA